MNQSITVSTSILLPSTTKLPVPCLSACARHQPTSTTLEKPPQQRLKEEEPTVWAAVQRTDPPLFLNNSQISSPPQWPAHIAPRTQSACITSRLRIPNCLVSPLPFSPSTPSGSSLLLHLRSLPRPFHLSFAPWPVRHVQPLRISLSSYSLFSSPSLSLPPLVPSRSSHIILASSMTSLRITPSIPPMPKTSKKPLKCLHTNSTVWLLVIYIRCLLLKPIVLMMIIMKLWNCFMKKRNIPLAFRFMPHILVVMPWWRISNSTMNKIVIQCNRLFRIVSEMMNGKAYLPTSRYSKSVKWGMHLGTRLGFQLFVDIDEMACRNVSPYYTTFLEEKKLKSFYQIGNFQVCT